MYFDATAANITTLLVIAFAVCVLWLVLKKRVESNLPLAFYLGLLIFENFTDRGVNQALYGAGLVVALLIRFEFLNAFLTRCLLVLQSIALSAIILSLSAQTLGFDFYW